MSPFLLAMLPATAVDMASALISEGRCSRLSKHRQLLEGARLPQDFLDSINEFLGSQASPNLIVTILTGTSLRLPAGADNAQVAVAINGKWRYNSANADAAAPGGLITGDNPIFVAASDNAFSTNPSPPPTELDSTDYTFRLIVKTAGGTPSGVGTEALYRQIGWVTWNGSAFTDVRQFVGGPAGAKHAATHAPGSGDALDYTLVHLRGTLGARPSAVAANNGLTYYATDVNSGTLYRSTGAAWEQTARGVTEALAHAASHAPGGADALPWGTINGYGTFALRPAAASTNLGYLYFASDTTTLYRSNGTTWDTETPTPPSNVSIAGAILAFGTLASRPAAGGGNTNFYYYATDVAAGTLYQSTGAAWFQVGASAGVSFNRQTANYVLVLGDAGKVVEMNVAGANTLTVPTNASVPFPIGTTITPAQYGAGQTTITPAGGVTIRSIPGLKLVGQYAMASLIKVGTDEWYAAGNLSA